MNASSATFIVTCVVLIAWVIAAQPNCKSGEVVKQGWFKNYCEPRVWHKS